MTTTRITGGGGGEGGMITWLSAGALPKSSMRTGVGARAAASQIAHGARGAQINDQQAADATAGVQRAGAHSGRLRRLGHRRWRLELRPGAAERRGFARRDAPGA